MQINEQQIFKQDIVIFEDKKEYRLHIENMIDKINHKIFSYSLSVALSTDKIDSIYKYIATSKNSTIYLIDLLIGDENLGFSVIEEIRNSNNHDVIIVITDYPQHIKFSSFHKLSSSSVILKRNENLYDELLQTFTYVKNNIFNFDNQSLLLGKQQLARFLFDDIYMIMSVKNKEKIEVYLQKSVSSHSSTLKRVNKKMDKRFYRCHNSYIINLEKIEKVNKGNREITLDNGLMAYYSLRHRKALLHLLADGL